MFGLFKRHREQGQRVGGGNYREKVEYVNSEAKALKIAGVYRAVNLISSGVAVMQLNYKRRNRAKDYFMLYDHGEGRHINYLLSVRPNERMNAYTFFKNLVSTILLRGNAFVYPYYSGGKLLNLYLCTPGSVTYDVYRDIYQINDYINDLVVTCPSEEILHFKNFCMDGGYWGLSTIHYAAKTLGIAATGDSETLRRLATGGRFKAILQNNVSTTGIGEYQDEELEKMRKDLKDNIDMGEDLLAIRGDGKLTPISMSSADMQFLESRKFTLREIARYFNVPPSKLMDDTNANYKSAETANVSFYSEALQPIVTEIEREFSAKMLRETTCMDYKFVYDLSKLYALDLDGKGKWDKSRLDTGQATVNEIRRENDKEPVEKGDEVYISMNLAPIGSPKITGENKVEKQKEAE